MNNFQRIKRLPPYVFGIVNELKAAARASGEDIIDFGMGNPDQPTPQHIVDKLTEAAQKGDTHRYSISKGIPRLRKAICDWYQKRYDVSLDPETQAIVTIGSKEGLAHLALACVGPGDTVLVPNPSYQYILMVSLLLVQMCVMCRCNLRMVFLKSYNARFRNVGRVQRCW
jgi:alanine-synthesizing transaminase